MADKTVRQIIAEEGGFDTLNKAVEETGLSDLLSDEGPYTLFAPTDEAFGELPQDKLAELMSDKEQLAGIINHHLLAADYTAAELAEIDSVDTLDGMSLDVSKSDGAVMVERAEIIRPDIEATNGVVHTINRVLLP